MPHRAANLPSAHISTTALNVPWHVIQKLLEIELLWMVVDHFALQVAAASLHFAAAVRHAGEGTDHQRAYSAIAQADDMSY